MKSGAGDNPWEDDEESVAEQGEPVTDSNGNDGVPPYAMRRNAVKDERDMVPFWLQDGNEERLEAVKGDVEDRLGYSVYLTDFKEAAVLEGLENPRGIARRLDEWGCEYA